MGRKSTFSLDCNMITYVISKLISQDAFHLQQQIRADPLYKVGACECLLYSIV